MNSGVIPLSAAVALALASLPALADTNPDFDDDAKPLLRVQPGLIQYVQSHFDIKDTGTAKYPGDDDRRPVPPYIFRARLAGSHGPYNLRLLIQPGPPDHILKVVDMAKVHLNEPGQSAPNVASRPPAAPLPPRYTGGEPENPPSQAAPYNPGPVVQPPPSEPPVAQTPPPSAPAPAPQAPSPTEPTADTPSGPIMGPDTSSSGQPSLAPPPDPAPASQ